MQGISASNFKCFCSFDTEKVFLPHWIEAQGEALHVLRRVNPLQLECWLMILLWFPNQAAAMQSNRLYNLPPFSIPALSRRVQVPTWVWKKTQFDGHQLLNFSDCLIASAKGNRNDSVNSYFGHTSTNFGWGRQLLQVKKWGGEGVNNLQLILCRSIFNTILGQ